MAQPVVAAPVAITAENMAVLTRLVSIDTGHGSEGQNNRSPGEMG